MAAREDQAHIAIAHWLRVALPPGWVISHAANGGLRTKREQAKFKAMGLAPGYPDLVIHGQRLCAPWTGFMEVKAPAVRLYGGIGRIVRSAGVLSDEQRAMHDALRAFGFPVVVVHSIGEARDACRSWDIPIRDVTPRAAQEAA